MIDLKTAREKLKASKEDKTLEAAVEKIDEALKKVSVVQNKLDELKRLEE